MLVTDNGWVNGRKRSMEVYTAVEKATGDKKVPPNPDSITAVIKVCGKVKHAEQVGLLALSGGVPLISPENAEAVQSVVADYRARIREIVQLADLPHRLPPASEVQPEIAGVVAGPRKPPLEAAFKPMGYSCRGGTGEFHLTRQTAGNLTVELYLDVGTWSRQVSAVFMVTGPPFKASLIVPVTSNDFGQYPIGDAAQWQKIVENALAAMVRELDRSFVPAIEQAAGPSPEWYQPPILGSY